MVKIYHRISVHFWWQNNISNEIFGDNLVTNFIKKSKKMWRANGGVLTRMRKPMCARAQYIDGPANHLANSNESFKQLANH